MLVISWHFLYFPCIGVIRLLITRALKLSVPIMVLASSTSSPQKRLMDGDLVHGFFLLQLLLWTSSQPEVRHHIFPGGLGVKGIRPH